MARGTSDISFRMVVERCYNREVCGWLHLLRSGHRGGIQVSVPWSVELKRSRHDTTVSLGDIPKGWDRLIEPMMDDITREMATMALVRAKNQP